MARYCALLDKRKLRASQGTAYVYDTVLRPFIAQHENDIDRKLKECRARAWDLTVFYWQNCAVLGQAAFFQLLQFLASQTGKFSENSKKVEKTATILYSASINYLSASSLLSRNPELKPTP